MTWDESKHPRKENGEFTFKNAESISDSKNSNSQAPFNLRAEVNVENERPANLLHGDTYSCHDNYHRSRQSIIHCT